MRNNIGVEAIEKAEEALYLHVFEVVARKGSGAFSSSHEVLGVLTDESSELVKAISNKEGLSAVRHELLDIAAACVFAVSCIDSEAMDW